MELIQEIQSVSLLKKQIAYWYIGQVGYVFKVGTTVIAVDPVLNDLVDEAGKSMRDYDSPFAPDMLKVDYVFCTHGHIDHMAPETLLGLIKANPNIKIIIPVGCKQMAANYGLSMERVTCLGPGESKQICDDLSVKAVSAAHPLHVISPDDADMALGYQIQMGDIFVTHLGDTYLTELLLKELLELPVPNLFFAPINGDDLYRQMDNCIGNMEAEEVAKLAVTLQADVTIPTHYDMVYGNMVDPLRFVVKLRELDSSKKWRLPALGECSIYQGEL